LPYVFACTPGSVPAEIDSLVHPGIEGLCEFVRLESRVHKSLFRGFITLKMLDNKKLLRIISIGTVVPNPNPGTQGLVVPCIVEIEKDGVISEWKLARFGVRQVYNQPGRLPSKIC